MAHSCVICAQVRNSMGKVVDSKLFTDLLHYTSSRTQAKQLYKVGKDKRFLDKVQDQAEFDENGEITLQSLLKLTKTDLKEGPLLDRLNKELGSGIYLYSDAMQRLQNFNRNNQWNSKYMATIVSDNNGKYKLSVVKRTTSNEEALNKVIANQSLQERLIYYLEKNGIKADFLKDNSSSRYSTENATRSADGFYHLIKLANGEYITEELAEEAGHFAIGALGNSPLVERLINILTPEVQLEALGEDEYNSKFLGKDARREVAGTLVGRALLKEPDTRTGLGRLVSRISNLAKRVFYSIKGNDIKVARLNAERLADQIARGFMSPNFTGDVTTALETKETLYSSDLSANVKVYKQVCAQMRAAVNEFKAMNSDLADVFKGFLDVVQVDKDYEINTTIGSQTDALALGGVAQTLDLLIDYMQNTLPTLLDTVDFDNSQDFAYNMSRNGHTLREAHIATQRCFIILNEISKFATQVSNTPGLGIVAQYKDLMGVSVTKNIDKLTQELGKYCSQSVSNGPYAMLLQKEAQFYLKFLEDSLGSTYVERGARVLFNWENWNKKGKSIIEFAESKKINLSDIVQSLENDISLFDRFLGSMSNASDIVCQITDKVIKQSNKWAEDYTNEVWDQLKVLQEELNAIEVDDPEIFYERDKDGNLTGNIVSETNFGQWEKEYYDFKKQCQKDYKDAHRIPGTEDQYDYDNDTDFMKAFKWKEYFEPLNKEWHKQHSIVNKESGRHMPDPNLYPSRQWQENFESSRNTQKRIWLNKFRELKSTLDAFSDDAMPPYRMPQFKGTFMNRVRNRGSRLNPKLYGRGISEVVREAICVDSEDMDYGGYNTYNSREEDMFDNQVNFEKEKLNRLPLFGINRLEDMSQLSTDIFHSMLSYASVVTHYAAMSRVVDTVEIGSNVLQQRHVENTVPEMLRRGDKSLAYGRYLKYLDKQVYGVSQRAKVITKGIVINKVAGLLSGLSSKVFLGGNVAGGIVNTMTGVNEIFKESIAGEYFTTKDWANASKDYWKSLPSNWWGVGKQSKEDKVSLFIRRFNILGDAKAKERGWSTYKSRAANFIFGESLMLPYSSGDHYMQSMSYLAVANGTKLYTRNGIQTSLWNAYQVQNIEDASGRQHKAKTIGLKSYNYNGESSNIYFKSREDIQTYNFLDSIRDKMQFAIDNAVQINLTQEEQDYINSMNWSVSDMDQVLWLVTNQMSKLRWNENDESAYMDKCREINNRLHGIYNEQDKTAFHQNIFGNMVLAMRGYALGMAQRRFGTNKYSIALGGETEGTYRTLAKVIASCRTDEMGFGRTIRALTLPLGIPGTSIGENTKKMMMDAGFSYNQYANMRRNMGDLLLAAALAILKMLTAKGDGDDEEDELEKKAQTELLKRLEKTYGKQYAKNYKKWMIENQDNEEIDLTGTAYYFASRLLREQIAWNYPQAMTEEWSTITSLMPSGGAVLKDLWSLGTYMYGDFMYDYEEDETDYEQLKSLGYTANQISELRKQRREELQNAPGKEYFYQNKGYDYKQGDPKWVKKWQRMTPYLRSRNVLYHPYDAAKSFDYGRQVIVK